MAGRGSRAVAGVTGGRIAADVKQTRRVAPRSIQHITDADGQLLRGVVGGSAQIQIDEAIADIERRARGQLIAEAGHQRPGERKLRRREVAVPVQHTERDVGLAGEGRVDRSAVDAAVAARKNDPLQGIAGAHRRVPAEGAAVIVVGECRGPRNGIGVDARTGADVGRNAPEVAEVEIGAGQADIVVLLGVQDAGAGHWRP